MRLIVPTTFERSFLESLADYPVNRIYGSLPTEAGARAKAWLPQAGEDDLKPHIADARSRGIGFYYTLNASCGGNREFSGQGQKWLAERLGWLVEAGAEGIVTANPYLMDMVKQRYPELRVCVSTLANVDTVEKALFYERMGADTIYVADYINRDFKLLKAIKKRVSCELVIALNLGCLMQCPFREYHANFVSHASETLDHGCYLDYSLARCTQIKSTTPVELMKAPWIRPEDVVKYEKMGFTAFKIAGREMGGEWVLRAVAAYAACKYAGNLNDLMIGFEGVDPFGEFPVYLDNSRLDGFIDFFAKKDCRLGCNGCSHCEEWLQRAITVDGNTQHYSDRIDRLIRRFTSGSFKAPLARAAF
ncbi:MAG: U32 family peptidase [Deltaproteobacteria bacterium]|nr:U32 family peptidase [Deltaproteobacteria bacterium]